MKRASVRATAPALSAVLLSVAATFLALFAANHSGWLRFVALAVALLLIVAASALMGWLVGQARPKK